MKIDGLTWSQVHAWHLAQHGLAPRIRSGDAVQAATRACGIQAQVMSAAELAIATRVEGIHPSDVASALWRDRTLIKTWTMRGGTLHLLAASDLPLYVAARGFRADTPPWSTYFASYGITPTQQEAFLAAVPRVLGREPMTRQQLAEAVARYTGVAHLRDFILSSSWGSPLKPSALRGDLCFGPNQGRAVTFVNPRVWIGTWQPCAQEQALQEQVRRYLQAYGPATPEDFARWWWGGSGKAHAQRLFQSIGEELTDVEVEGWRAFALRATLEQIHQSHLKEREALVHLLPLFDAYTIGMPRNREPILASSRKGQVFRPQGWISAVVLVNGSIQGIWHSRARRAQTLVSVQLFCMPTASIRKGIEAEVARLREFFATDVRLELA